MKIKIIVTLLFLITFLIGTVFGFFIASRKNKAEFAEPETKAAETSAPGESTPTVLTTDLTDLTNAPVETAAPMPQNRDFADETDYTDEITDLLSAENEKAADYATAFMTADSQNNELTFYAKYNSEFRKICSCYAWFGQNGVSADKKEGDLCTPRGLYDLGTAFGLDDNPGTDYPFRKATENSYWVDDSDSKFYNQWVEMTDETEKDWNSAERLSDYPNRYNCGFVIEYNTVNTVPGNGSAIFLHCGDRDTLGCIAVSPQDMQKIILNLHQNDKVQIFIY